jgi:tetratricopeptide (TPR) repeat protein
MSFRFGAVGMLFLALTLGACGGAGNGPAGDQIAPQEFSDDDLPQWMQDLPEGTPPRDNEHTGQATLFLVQAMQTEGERAEGLYRQALEAALAGIEADPENPQSYYQAGDAYLGLGQIEEGAEMFDRAEEIYPRYVLETELTREQAWVEQFNQGAELSEQGDRDAAAEYFARAHRIYQGRPEAMLNLAEIYGNQGRTEEAAELYREAIELMTGPRAEDMDEEFQEMWDEFLEISYFNRAQLLFRMERYGEAADVYERILQEDPENLTALSNLAASLVAAGREGEAQALYDRLLESPDLNASDYFMIAIGLYQGEAWEQSARAFRESLDRVPENRDAAFNLAQTLYLAENWEELVAVTERLLEIDTHNETAYRFRAQGLVQLEDQQTAVEALEQMEALPFYVDQLELHPGEGGVSVVGLVVTNAGDPGSTADLRFHFYDVEGNQVGSEDISVELPQPEEAVQFQLDHMTNEPVFAFRYEVL